MKKTYDPEIDQLIQELRSPFMVATSPGEELVVEASVAERAAEMIFHMYQRLSKFEAEDYNRQIGGY